MQAMKEHPVDFLVYAKRFPGQSDYEQYEHIEYRRFSNQTDDVVIKPFKFIEKLLDFPIRKRPSFSWEMAQWAYGYQIARDLQKRDCDIVHIMNYSQLAPIIKRFNPNVKIVLHMQCDWLFQLDAKMIEKRLRKVDLILGCSDHVSRGRRRNIAVRKSMPDDFNGVDVSRFDRDNSFQREEGAPQQSYLSDGFHRKRNARSDRSFQHCGEVTAEHTTKSVGPVGSAPYEYMALITTTPKCAH
jgi:hypothetical protein